MIDWGSTPPGTVGTLYLPGVNASEVIQLADRLYSLNPLNRLDPHSVQMRLPAGQLCSCPLGRNRRSGRLADPGPAFHVRKGQTFRVVLHQVIDSPAARPRLLRPAGASHRSRQPRPRRRPNERGRLRAAVGRDGRASRHIVGSFQFSVQVQTAAQSCRSSNARGPTSARGHTIPIENRWYPVMQRYLNQVSAKLTGLGGRHEDGDRDHDRDRVSLEGKVEGIRYDCSATSTGSCCAQRTGPMSSARASPTWSGS